MFTKDLEIVNKTGLHARPASGLVRLCKEYESNITIIFGEKEINAKSIMHMLAAGISKGSKITLVVEGSDEDSAGAEIVNYIETLTE